MVLKMIFSIFYFYETLKMDAVIAIKSSNFCLIAQDTIATRSIIVNHPNYQKISVINETLYTNTGPQGNASQLSSYANESALHLSVAYNLQITPSLISTVFQNEIHKNLRQNPSECGAIVCGKENNGYKLYNIDPYGALIEGDYFCVGYVSLFGYGIIDDCYKKDLNLSEAIEVIKKIGDCLKKRFAIRYNKFNVKFIDDKGVQDMIVEF